VADDEKDVRCESQERRCSFGLLCGIRGLFNTQILASIVIY